MCWLPRIRECQSGQVRQMLQLTVAMVWLLAALRSSAQNKPDSLADPLPHPIEQLRGDPQWRVYAAVVNHDHQELQTLLDGGDSPNGVQSSNGVPLILAVQLGDLEAVKILLSGGADIDRPDGTGAGFNALIYAAQHRDIEVVRYLLSKGAQVNARNTFYGETAVFRALSNSDYEMLSVLIDAGADVNLRNKAGLTPLMTAAWGNDYDMVKFLKAHGAKFNSPGEELLYAAIQGDVADIQRLVAAGAKVNQSYLYGRTPLMLAAQNGETAAVKTLIAAGADINALCSNHETPLMYAAFSRHKSTILALLDAGADVNISNNYGGTALSGVAMLLDDPDLVHLLIRHGASIDGAGGPTQITPLIAATSSGATKTVRIFLDAHVSVNTQTTAGLTALMQAAMSGRVDILALLLRAGADPTIKDKQGKTALDWAMQEHQQVAVDVLRKPPSPTTSSQ